MTENENNEEKQQNITVNIDIEEALLQTGGYGKFQLILQLAISYILLISGYQALLLYFTADDPPWKCTKTAASSFCLNNANQTISVDNKDFNRRCRFSRNDWEYTTKISYSIVTEYELVCHKEALGALSKSIFYIGWGVSGIFIGSLADSQGRKPGIYLSLFLMVLASLVSPLVTSITQIIITRAIIGAGFGGISTCSFVLLSEFIDDKNLAMAANCAHLPFYLSVFILAIAAYFLREWRKLSLFMSFPGILALAIVIMLPESPRWLLATRRYDKAESIIKSIGVINNKPLKNFSLNTQVKDSSKLVYSYCNLFSNLRIATPVLILCFLWCSAGALYYGMSFEASGLGGDLYTDLFLLTAVDVPATFISAYANNALGCKTSSIVSFIMSGCFMLLVAFTPPFLSYSHFLKISCAMLGKLNASIAFSSIILWAYQLFPIIIRTQGFTICQIAARLGSAFSPFIVTDFRNVYKKLPYFIFAGFALISGILSCFMPVSITLQK